MTAPLQPSAPPTINPQANAMPGQEKHARLSAGAIVTTPIGPGSRQRNKNRKRRRRVWRRVGLLLVLPLIVCAVAVGVLLLRLQYGPVQASWLAPVIERALGHDAAESLGGDRISVENVDLRWVPDRGLLVGLENVRVLSAASPTPIVTVPIVEVQPSWRALIYGQLAAERIELVNPRLTIVTGADGSRSLSLGRTATSPSDQVPGSIRTSSAASEPAQSIELGTAIREASARARRRENASAFLRTVGLRNATLIIDHGERKSLWRVPEFSVDLRHRAFGSTVTGRATVASLSGTWGIEFATVEQAENGAVSVAVTLSGLIPRGIARSIPQLALLEALDVPVSGTGQFDLAASGQLIAARMTLSATPGRIFLPWLGRAATRIDGAQFELVYDGVQRRITLPKIDLRWDENRLMLKGDAVHTPTPEQDDAWVWDVSSIEGQWAGPAPGAPPVAIEMLAARGQFSASAGRLILSSLLVKAAGAELTATGDVTEMGRSGRLPRAVLEGQTSPMNIETITTLWPRETARGARDWVARSIRKGEVLRGLFKLATEAAEVGDGAELSLPQPGQPPQPGDARLSLTIEAGGVELVPVAGAPAIELPRGLIRIEGQSLEVTAADAFIGPAGPQRINLKTARFSVAGLGADEQPLGEFAARITGGLSAVLELADRDPFKVFKSNGIALPQIDGRVDGFVKFTLPLGENVQISEIRPEAKIRVTDIRTRNLTQGIDLTGGALSIDTNDRAIDVKGDILVKGVPAKIFGQYVLNQPADKQPPLRITTTLDATDRAQLGIDVGDLVSGEVPIEVIVQRGDKGELVTRVRGDLSKAELSLTSIAWRKAQGRPATIQFDVVRTKDGRTELAPFRIVGDDIAAEGTLLLGPDNKLREFKFPVFTVNVVSQLNVSGRVRPDGVWEIRAFGPRFDARDLFRRLLSFGSPPVVPQPPRGVRPQRSAAPQTPDKDIDLVAEVETVLGFSDLTMRTVRVQLSRRNDKVSALDVAGLLETGRPFATVMRQNPERGGGRQILTEALDAGQFMKLVGFYPNAVGGELEVEIDIDANQGTERRGRLWMRNFTVLGDTVVNEVLQGSARQSNPTGQAPIQPRAGQRVVREQIPFDLLLVPFSIGSGQFVMGDASIRGPLLGATWRGRIDNQQRTLQIGGTYAPLSSLGGALGSFPILGQIIAGPKGEGIFGITFSINGPMSRPEVIVNPLSLIAPGMFRDIFQMQPDQFRIIKRNDDGTVAGPQRTPPKAATAPSKQTRPQP